MKISIFGLGYVGCVSAACLADDCHEVLGVDTNAAKVASINRGESPIVEPGLDDLMARHRASGLLAATTGAADAVASTQASFVCIQTPSAANGSLDLQFVLRVAEEIGTALRDKAQFHVVVFRSTMLPGTMQERVVPILEKASGKRCGEHFGVAYHPEFLREGSAIADYRHPPKTVIGTADARSADIVASLYDGIDAPLVRCALRTAEIVKYADNAFHALKVAFANEIGAICRATDIDSHEVMDIFCQDKKLNLSATYLKPGYAFGGSCLPKDLRALAYLARTLDLNTPVLEGTLVSNAAHKHRALSMVVAQGKKQVGILGLSFKDGTDDLRESPTVELVEQLVGKGYQVRIFDPHVNVTRLTGANKAYIDRELPHIATLLVDHLADLISYAQVVVATKRSSLYEQAVAMLRPDQYFVDFVRIVGDDHMLGDRYDALVG
jgi:GDP-mannose 6-dehydrogenase